jgi:hypothetical protein
MSDVHAAFLAKQSWRRQRNHTSIAEQGFIKLLNSQESITVPVIEKQSLQTSHSESSLQTSHSTISLPKLDDIPGNDIYCILSTVSL